jgi:hypothetical protein
MTTPTTKNDSYQGSSLENTKPMARSIVVNSAIKYPDDIKDVSRIV